MRFALTEQVHTGEASGESVILDTLTRAFFILIMEANTSTPRSTRAERETETAAHRLTALVDDALAAVAAQSNTDAEALEACAARLERAARDLTVALRELARERRLAYKENS